VSVPNIKSLDHRVKVWLLVVSLLTIVILAGAAWREAFGSEWRRHQRRYESILETKATDQRGQDLLERFSVELRQTVVPELNSTDRCISCHTGIDDPRMSDVGNPYSVHPGDLLRDHPPAQYGCTVCHRGQGLAVVFAEVKGDGYFWDYPMLPTEFTQSSCGLCHTPQEVAQLGGEVLAEGERLFYSKGCLGCHQLNSRGGNMGPALDNEGLKVPHQLPMADVEGPHTLPQWLVEHFDSPQTIVAGSQMRNSGLSYEETIALTTFVLSLQERDLPRSYLSPAFHASLAERAGPSSLTGEELYGHLCSTCHGTGRFGSYDKFYRQFMPAVRNPAFLTVADPEFIVATINRGRPGTLMPAWGQESGGLSGTEIDRVAQYLRDGNTEAAPSGLTTTADLTSGNFERGSAYFKRLCVGCHGASGVGGLAPALANREFQAIVGAEFLYSTIALGRRNTAMPSFRADATGGLSDNDIIDLIAYLKSLGASAGASVAQAEIPGQPEQLP